jgi:hypothetical protein
MLTNTSRAAVLALSALAMTLSGCAGKKVKGDTSYIARDVNTLYGLAKEALVHKEYERSAKLFDEVERQHPYSIWARRSQLMSAFSYYMAQKYPEAVSSSQRLRASADSVGVRFGMPAASPGAMAAPPLIAPSAGREPSWLDPGGVEPRAPSPAFGPPACAKASAQMSDSVTRNIASVRNHVAGIREEDIVTNLEFGFVEIAVLQSAIRQADAHPVDRTDVFWGRSGATRRSRALAGGKPHLLDALHHAVARMHFLRGNGLHHRFLRRRLPADEGASEERCNAACHGGETGVRRTSSHSHRSMLRKPPPLIDTCGMPGVGSAA